CFKNENKELKWTTYPAPKPNDNEYKPICNGTISTNYEEFDSKRIHVFSVENGKYGIIITTKESSTYLNLYWINNNCEFNGPTMIYTIPTLITIEIYQCNMAYQSSGYNCLIYYEKTIDVYEFINIVFFHKGTVNVNGTTTYTIDEVPDIYNPFCAMTLYNGGYILLTETVVNTTIIKGIVVSNEGKINSTGWGLPDIYQYLPIAGVTYENTVWAISISNTPNSYYNYSYESWSIVTSTSLSDYG
ncbi:6433_t:CDS:2, partial [Dentiscutata erythropus]